MSSDEPSGSLLRRLGGLASRGEKSDHPALKVNSRVSSMRLATVDRMGLRLAFLNERPIPVGITTPRAAEASPLPETCLARNPTERLGDDP